MIGCRALTVDECMRLLAELKTPRDKALFTLGIYSGFRISEMLSLTIADVWSDGKARDYVEVKRKSMKGKASGRIVPLHAVAQAAIAHVCARVCGNSTLPLCSQTAPLLFPITRNHAWHLIHSAARRAAIDGKIGTHSLRKTFALNVHKALGSDILKTQKALGHKSLASTASYLSVDPLEIESAIKGL